MKKVVLLGVIAAAAITSASAQGISVGPRIGVNFAKLAMTDGDSEEKDFVNDNTKSRIGLQIGVAANLGITESFSIQPELLYSQQGTKIEFSETEESELGEIKIDGTQEVMTNYLQLPVLARYSFGSDDVKFFVNAGPYVGYWMSGKVKSEATASLMGFSETESEEQDIEFDKEKDGFEANRLDAGLVAGAGVGFNAGPGMLVVDFRYNLGMSNVFKPEDGDETKQANRFFGVGVSYMFGMGE